MTTNHHTELERASAVAPLAQLDQAYLRLWFALAKRPWRSVVLVPGHVGGSASEAARKLADVGQKVSGAPVKAIAMGTLDYGTALALADLQDQLRRLSEDLGREAPQSIEVAAGPPGSAPNWVPAPEPGSQAAPGSGPDWVWERMPEGPDSRVTMDGPATARFIIAVPCPLSEPLSLSATHGADGVILVVELGRTRTAEVQAILEQVGRERVVGCILVR